MMVDKTTKTKALLKTLSIIRTTAYMFIYFKRKTNFWDGFKLN